MTLSFLLESNYHVLIYKNGVYLFQNGFMYCLIHEIW